MPEPSSQDINMAEHNGLTFRSGEYRKHLPNLNVPRFQMMKKQNAHEYVHDFKTNHAPPWLYALYEHWRSLLAEPFKGVTSDGPYLLHLTKVISAYHIPQELSRTMCSVSKTKASMSTP